MYVSWVARGQTRNDEQNFSGSVQRKLSERNVHQLERVLNRHISCSIQVFLKRGDVRLWIATQLGEALRDPIAGDHETKLTERVLAEVFSEKLVHQSRDHCKA